MARTPINTGTVPNDNTGDAVRQSLINCEANFIELYSRFGSSTIIVEPSAASISAALASITDNIQTVYATGTLSVTNASDQITFGTPPVDTIHPGLDLLYDVANDRYYEMLEGPSVSVGGVFTLNEVYQGSTDAAYANTTEWVIVRPNPYKILVNPGLFEITTDTTAIECKPFVNIEGIDKDAVIIRRFVAGAITPLFIIAHGSVVSGVTVECSDSLFEFYRMGLSAKAVTSQIEAMKRSRWIFRDCNFNCIDPNALDSGSDMYLSNQYYNGDKVLFDRCNFTHCWDGFTPQTTGSGRVEFKFIDCPVVKHRIPEQEVSNASGASFMRAGLEFNSYNVDVIMIHPSYDQVSFCGPENPGSTFTGALGEYGFCFIGQGSTGIFHDPHIEMDFGAITDSKFRGGIVSYGTTGNVLVLGGYINLANTGTVNGTPAALIQSSTAVFEVVSDGKYSSTAGTIT